MKEVYTLPEGICIDGIFYAVNTDFKTWIKAENIISGDENIFEKTKLLLMLCYKDSLPPTLGKAMEGITWFLSCAKSEKSNLTKKSHSMPVVDFCEDEDMIAAAFLHDYNINLWEETIHWWKFRALFSNLSEENKIVKVMGYRAVNIGDIKDKEQKKFYRKMKSIYKLKDKRTPEEREKNMLDNLSQIFEEVQ